jgi:hypothetical protein
MKPSTGNVALAWVAALPYLFVVSWPYVSQSPMPFIGLRQLTTPSVGWPLALIALLMALFLSVPRFVTRDRLLICAGFSLCLFVAITFYVSPVAAIPFLFIGANIIRETGAARPPANVQEEGTF